MSIHAVVLDDHFYQITKNHRYQNDTALLHPVEKLTSVHADFVKIHVLDVSVSDQNLPVSICLSSYSQSLL